MDQVVEQSAQTALLKDRYEQALKAGDGDEARRIVKDALDRGTDPPTIYFGIFAPALVAIGHAWRRGQLTIAAEHHATSITLQQIAHVGELWRLNRKKDIGASVVIAAVEGEMHTVGVRMIADLFDMDGWHVSDLGQNNPTDDLVDLVGERKPDLVILSVSQPDLIPVAARAAAMLTALEHRPAVFVGGPGLSHEPQAAQVAADLVSSSPFEALRVGRQLVGIDKEHATLQDHLSALGHRVLALRKQRGWSQQELALRAGLDRTYLSAVEKGKQNITIGAALKIADALGASLSDLID